MPNPKIVLVAIFPVVLLTSCSLLIDTNPDGVINEAVAGRGTTGTSQNTPGTASGGTAASGRTKSSSSTDAMASASTPVSGGSSGIRTSESTGASLGGSSGARTQAPVPTGGSDSAAGASSGITMPVPSNGGTKASDASTGGQSGQSASVELQRGGASTNTFTTGGRTSTGGVATGGATLTSSTGGSTTAPTTTTTSSGCGPGTRICVNNVPQLCGDNGQWQPDGACSGVTPTCKDGNCVCSTGTKQCKNDGTTPQLCTASGTWQDQPKCSGASPYCYGAGECAVCQEGSKKCSGSTPQICAAGSWVPQVACSGTTPYCNGEGVCGACSTASRQCEGNTPQLCTAAGKWQNQTTCSGTTPACTGEGVCGCPNSGGPPMVGLPVGFCIDSTEVTRAQYAAWLSTNPSTAGQTSDCSWNTTFTPNAACLSAPFTCESNCSSHPQICVDWCDAYAYCKGVGKRLCGQIGGGSVAFYNFDSVSRSQWYSACTSNGTNTYTYGDTFSGGATCNIQQSYNYATVAVDAMQGCQSPESGYKGVYHLIGNAYEWEDSCDGAGQSANCRVRGGYHSQMGESATCVADMAYPRDTSGEGSTNSFRCCAP